MHGCTCQAGLGACGDGDSAGVQGGPPQRKDAGRPVVSGRAQHGAVVADTPEPAADIPAPRTLASELGGLRAPGGRDRRRPGGPCAPVGVAPLGRVAGDPHSALHPQAQAQLAGTPISTASVLAILGRQRYRCALSGRELTPQTTALDHIVPVRRGGAHVVENAQLLDKDVNRAKGPLTSDEFIALCGEVVRWCGDAGAGREGGETP